MNRQFDRIGKITRRAALLAVITTGLLGGTIACSDSSSDATAPSGGMASVQDKNSQPNVLQIAVGSKDHTTLVTAVKAAGLADSLANPGPFTVFAPTDAAFQKLPPGTVEGLLDKKAELKDILEYHVYVGGVQADYFTDGMVLNQANGKDVTIRLKDGKATVNGANIVASVKASNGVVHIIDGVLLPPSK